MAFVGSKSLNMHMNYVACYNTTCEYIVCKAGILPSLLLKLLNEWLLKKTLVPFQGSVTV